jgi:hypothetical protein
MTKNVTITLSEEQARVLSLVLASVGGDPTNSGRRVTNEISHKLWSVNMGYTSKTGAEYPMESARQSLWFADSLKSV